ncbi:alpha/beta fold hydrolase [Pseudoxanthomonas indica]|uniref:Pimeloyl-ACP methyl ester carboxylesterase n=1 Tax=Pseudoxanthomonas indica TaxID=428993 RepID=A0A1T5JXJ8_9GAMM|nr:alpha/beta fold hydrolase [Pseudoxanthomonas indica]SKC55989.1 Pimeloyl-ACP methyl ester carboxylesterase [Pseudoxanthomonas indica]
MTPGSPRLPLLLLPGLLCDARLWRDQASGLADIADSRIADLTQDDSVAAMAARALAAAPPRFALAALSMGGYVAFEILRQAPERVTRLALLATSARADPPKRAAVRRASLALAGSGRFAGVTRKLLPQLVHARHVDDAVGQEVMAMAERVGRDAFLRQQQAILDRPDSSDLLPTLQLPTLVGVGDDDRMTAPEESRYLQAHIPGARLHVFTACGHLPPLEQPEATTALLRDWLLAA